MRTSGVQQTVLERSPAIRLSSGKAILGGIAGTVVITFIIISDGRGRHARRGRGRELGGGDADASR